MPATNNTKVSINIKSQSKYSNINKRQTFSGFGSAQLEQHVGSYIKKTLEEYLQKGIIGKLSVEVQGKLAEYFAGMFSLLNEYYAEKIKQHLLPWAFKNAGSGQHYGIYTGSLVNSFVADATHDLNDVQFVGSVDGKTSMIRGRMSVNLKPGSRIEHSMLLSGMRGSPAIAKGGSTSRYATTYLRMHKLGAMMNNPELADSIQRWVKEFVSHVSAGLVKGNATESARSVKAQLRNEILKLQEETKRKIEQAAINRMQMRQGSPATEEELGPVSLDKSKVKIPPTLSYNKSAQDRIKQAGLGQKRAEDFQKRAGRYGRRDKTPIEVAGIPDNTPRNNRPVGIPPASNPQGTRTRDTSAKWDRQGGEVPVERGGYIQTPRELYERVRNDIQNLTNGRVAEVAHPAALLNAAVIASLAKDNGVPIGEVARILGGSPRIVDGVEDTSSIDNLINDLNDDKKTGYNQIVNLSTINNIPDNQDDSTIRDKDPRGVPGQAKTLKQAYLERQKDAEDRLLKGEDPQDIWFETGWVYDPINRQWVTELPYGKVQAFQYIKARREAEDPTTDPARKQAIEDQIGSKVPRDPNANPKLKLENILDAPFLYYVIPSFRDVPVYITYDTTEPNTGGYMDRYTPRDYGKPVIALNAACIYNQSDDPVEGPLVPLIGNLKGLVKAVWDTIGGMVEHEIGHAIQHDEGRIPGASPDTYADLYNTTDKDAYVVPLTPHRRLNALRMAQYIYDFLLKGNTDLQDFFTKTNAWESVLGKHSLLPQLKQAVENGTLQPHELEWYRQWSNYVDLVQKYTKAIDTGNMDLVTPIVAYRLSNGEMDSQELGLRSSLTDAMRRIREPGNTPKLGDLTVGWATNLDRMHSEFLYSKSGKQTLLNNIPITPDEYTKAGMGLPTSTGLPTDKTHLDLDHGYGVATVKDPTTDKFIITNSPKSKTGAMAVSDVDTDHLLFWDVPLNQQPVWKNILSPQLTKLLNKLSADLPSKPTGKEFFENLVKHYSGTTSDPDEAKLKATQDLIKLGVYGASYVTKGSGNGAPVEAGVTLWTLDPKVVGQAPTTAPASKSEDTKPTTVQDVVDRYIGALPQLRAHFQKFLQPILALDGGNSPDIEATGRTPIKSRLETDPDVLQTTVENLLGNDPSKLTGLFNVDVMFDSPNLREVAVSTLRQAQHFLRKFKNRFGLPQIGSVHSYEYSLPNDRNLIGVINMYTRHGLVYDKFKSLIDQWRDSHNDDPDYKKLIRTATKAMRGLPKKLDEVANTQDPKTSASLYAKLLGMGEALNRSSLPNDAGNSLSDLSEFIANTLVPKNQNSSSNVSSSANPSVANSATSSSGTSTATGAVNTGSNANTSTGSTSNSNVPNNNITQQVGTGQATSANPQSPQAYQVLYQTDPNEKPIYGYVENSDGTVSPVPLNRSSLLNSEPELLEPEFVRKGSTTFFPQIFDSNGRLTKEAQTLIEVFRNGDKSTIFHELAHTWLETMKEMFKRGMLKGQGLRDWKILGKELGFDGIDFTKPLSDWGKNVWRDAQEKFATAIEQYLWKGKAPSQRLRNIFRKVSGWLKQIYHKLTDIIYIDHNGQPQHFTPSKDFEDIIGRMLDNGISIMEVENALAYHPELREQITEPQPSPQSPRSNQNSTPDGASPATIDTSHLTEGAKAQVKAVIDKYKDTPKYMKAPNGKDTNLNELQWLLVHTPNFKEWFGDWEGDPANASKIVDANGEPLPVFHGTNVMDINVFRPSTKGWLGPGIYFTPYKLYANDYLRGKHGVVMPVFMNMRNPLQVRTTNPIMELLTRLYGDRAQAVYNNRYKEIYNRELKDFQERAKSGQPISAVEADLDRIVKRYIIQPDELKQLLDHGKYDGIAWHDAEELQELQANPKYDGVYHYNTEFMIPDSNQVKSAVSNNGNFSTTNNIYQQVSTSEDGYNDRQAGSNQPVQSTQSSQIRRSDDTLVSQGDVERYDQLTTHTTPNIIFDNRFNLAYMGTGEGNQAYGYGIYFTENPGVRDSYQDQFERETYRATYKGSTYVFDEEDDSWKKDNGEPLRDTNVVKVFSDLVEPMIRWGMTFEEIYNSMRDEYDCMSYTEDGQKAANILKGIESISVDITTPNTYIADIPHNDMLLDWDAPMSEQPKRVKAAIQKLITTLEKGTRNSNAIDYLKTATTGAGFYITLENLANPLVEKGMLKHPKFGTISRADMAASLMLNRVGIPGLRYFDDPSRSIKKGTHNFVIWNMDMIKLMGLTKGSSEEAKQYFYKTQVETLRNQQAGQATTYDQIGKKARNDMKASLRKVWGKQLSDKQIDELIGWINEYGEAESKGKKGSTGNRTLELATLHWINTQAVPLPTNEIEFNLIKPDIMQAVKICEQNKLDPQNFNSPQEIFDAYPLKPSKSDINPASIPQFSNETTYPHDIVVYDVENTKEGQKAVRAVIDAYYGVTANPWCIAQRYTDSDQDLDLAWDAWNSYNAILPRQIAFQNGRLVAFKSHHDAKAPRPWWDSHNEERAGIPYSVQEDGKVRVYLYDVEAGKNNPEAGETKKVVEERSKGKVLIYTDDGFKIREELDGGRTIRKWDKDSKSQVYERTPDGIEEEWYPSFSEEDRQQKSKQWPNGARQEWYDNGQDKLDRQPDGTEKTWYINGQEERTYKPLADGTYLEHKWYKNGVDQFDHQPDGTEYSWRSDKTKYKVIEPTDGGFIESRYDKKENLHYQKSPDGIEIEYYPDPIDPQRPIPKEQRDPNGTVRTWYSNGNKESEHIVRSPEQGGGYVDRRYYNNQINNIKQEVDSKGMRRAFYANKRPLLIHNKENGAYSWYYADGSWAKMRLCDGTVYERHLDGTQIVTPPSNSTTANATTYNQITPSSYNITKLADIKGGTLQEIHNSFDALSELVSPELQRVAIAYASQDLRELKQATANLLEEEQELWEGPVKASIDSLYKGIPKKLWGSVYNKALQQDTNFGAGPQAPSSSSTQDTSPLLNQPLSQMVQYVRVKMPDGSIKFVREGMQIEGRAIIQDKPTYVRIKQSDGTFAYVRSDQLEQLKQQSTTQQVPIYSPQPVADTTSKVVGETIRGVPVSDIQANRGTANHATAPASAQDIMRVYRNAGINLSAREATQIVADIKDFTQGGFKPIQSAYQKFKEGQPLSAQEKALVQKAERILEYAKIAPKYSDPNLRGIYKGLNSFNDISSITASKIADLKVGDTYDIPLASVFSSSYMVAEGDAGSQGTIVAVPLSQLQNATSIENLSARGNSNAEVLVADPHFVVDKILPDYQGHKMVRLKRVD